MPLRSLAAVASFTLARPLPRYRLRFSQIVLRVDIVRLQSEGFLELGNSFVRLTLSEESNAEIIVVF